jgi:hypothetical protein
MSCSKFSPSRRGLFAAAALPLLFAAPGRARDAEKTGESLEVIDGVQSELVMNLVVTCSDMEATGGKEVGGMSKDGVRDEVWPIIGGRFWGKGIRGTVVAGGGDFPYERPDKAVVVDALYRLKTDDGVTIVIHNKGLAYPPAPRREERYRLLPEFFAPAGKYEWLNKSIFIATLVFPVPPDMALAKGPHENDRLIQVYRID